MINELILYILDILEQKPAFNDFEIKILEDIKIINKEYDELIHSYRQTKKAELINTIIKFEKETALKLIEIYEELTAVKDTKSPKLFANDPEPGFIQSPKLYNDTFKSLITGFDSKLPVLKRRHLNHVGDGKDNKLSYNIPINENTTQDDIDNLFDQLVRVGKNPKHKLYYYALWLYAAKTGSRTFFNVNVSDILKIVYPGKRIQYRHRLDFTEFLEVYSRITIEKIIDKKETIKGNRSKTEWLDKSIWLFTKQGFFYSKITDNNGNIIEAKTIRKFSGELPKDLYNIGYYIPESIFMLDGNQTERINFYLELYRIKNQRYNYPGPLRLKRIELLEKAGLSQTNRINKTKANKLLMNTLMLGYKLNLLTKLPGKLSTEDDVIVEIYLNYPIQKPKQFN